MLWGSKTKTLLAVASIAVQTLVYSQDTIHNTSTGSTNSDEKLLKEYITSKGNNIITFDPTNIKLFWIDNNVVSRNDCFEIYMDSAKQESDKLTVQLANVKGDQDCIIDVITENSNIGYKIFNMDSKRLYGSSSTSSFLNYNVVSSSFHLVETITNKNEDFFRFQFVFSSKEDNPIKVKAIILSFKKNKNVILGSNGSFSITENNLNPERATLKTLNDGSITATGIYSIIRTKEAIELTDRPITTSVTLKNIGTTATKVYVGYTVYSNILSPIDSGNYPYRNNKVLHVVSAEKGSDKIIVDSYNDWTKGCCIALDAKDDLSDVPNINLCNEKILEFKQTEDGLAEITLDKPLSKNLKKGDCVRIHDTRGRAIYIKTKTLAPGEEVVISQQTPKNDSSIQYNSEAFSRGIFYIKPLILSYSEGNGKENIIQISNYKISY